MYAFQEFLLESSERLTDLCYIICEYLVPKEISLDGIIHIEDGIDLDGMV